MSATNRLLLFSPTATIDPAVAQRQQEHALAQTNNTLQSAQTKLRAYTLARNATVRQTHLKASDDEYWRAVVAMEGPPGVEGIWSDEEVQAAISRSIGSGSFDAARMEREAQHFVSNLTAGLDSR